MCLAIGQWNFICKNKEEAGFGLCSHSLPTPALNSNCQLIRHFHLQIPQVPQNSMFQHIFFYLLVLLSRFSRVRLCCDPIDGSPPGSPVPGILQVRTLEWVAISFSNAWKWKVKVKSLSHVQLSATPWTVAYQAPLSMGLSRQEYWSGVPLPSPGDLPDPGVKPRSPAL